jgi:hypothetical protein
MEVDMMLTGGIGVLREGAQQPMGQVIFKLFPYLNFSFDGSSSGFILGSFVFPVK